MRRNVDQLCAQYTMTCQNLTRELRSVNKGTSFLVAGFVSLSMPFNQHCGAIYLRSKSYLVFKISSDIMTKHCCQVCVLSMMFCRSDSRLCADMVSDGTIGKLEYHVVWLHSDRPMREMIWKIFFTFDFHILPQQRHIGDRIIPCHCISIKTKILPCWPICWQHRNHL